MPYDTTGGVPLRVAVIGAGISGMGAAYRLGRHHDVTLFEAEPRLGGHARTVVAGKRGDQPVDTGFIVFNYATYPHLTALFAELDVPVAESKMTFAASIDGGRVEYAIDTLNSLFGRRRNAISPGFLGMLRDIFRFNAQAEAMSQDDDTLTIGDLLDRLGTGARFRDHYLLPFSGAIWSMPERDVLDFPAAAMVRFFRNHALLGATGQHKWFTVRGGSIEYVRRLETAMRSRGVSIRLGVPIARVERAGPDVRVKARGAEWETFDHVIFATHGDDSLRMLGDADGVERAALAGVRYQPNTAVLHCDESLMPVRRRCWASWNYAEGLGGRDHIGLTYWMNSLQPIPKDDPLFVTLNATREINPSKIYDTVQFAHPVYDLGMAASQRAVATLNGHRNTWFCGAWMRNGFHEDGLATAMDVVNAISDRTGVLAA
jgi:predicted NAD/FAD-binding protein